MGRIHDMIKLHEGTGPMRNGNFMPYKDSVGLLTIGYGICIEKTGLRQNEADYILRSRVAEVENECLITFDWFDRIDEVRRAVVTDMVYNLGMPGFVKFVKFIGYIEREDYASASIEMLDSKWARQVGTRADRLSRMMETGQWPD